MNAFSTYARYYDLLYRDKNYDSEAAFVNEILQRHAPGAASLLEMGCGTGRHASGFASRGYRVHGVDASAEMLEMARRNLANEDPRLASKITFSRQDIRRLQAPRRYDAAVSLFHVMSYLPETTDLKAAVTSAKASLKSGGIFFFDCWYGPAVLTDRPTVRIKRMEDDSIRIVRIAEPSMDTSRNRVEIRYQVFSTDRSSGKWETFEETHLLRYLFTPEIHAIMRDAGFEPIESGEWMTGRKPGDDTWYVYFLGRA